MRQLPVCIYLYALINLFPLQGYGQPGKDTLSLIQSAEVQWVDQIPGAGLKKRHGAGNILAAIAGAGKTGEAAILKPVAILAGSPADVWFADQGTGSVFHIKNQRAEQPKVFARQKFFSESIVGICRIPDVGILFSDSRKNALYLLDADGKAVNAFTDTVLLKQPTGIAVNTVTKEVWVVETAAHRISIFDFAGKKLRSIGERGTGALEFNYPTSIWIDKKGFVYITDALNYRIQVLTSTGEFIHMFGKAGDASGYFGLPKGIATDSYGNIYVTDALFHHVQIFDWKGHFLYVFGQQGRENGKFWMPSGIFIDAADNIYVADSYNARIQIFNLINIVKRND